MAGSVAHTKQTGDCLFVRIMRVTSEGNDTQIVVAIVGIRVVHVHAIAVRVADIHKLAVRRKGSFCAAPSGSGALKVQTHLIRCK